LLKIWEGNKLNNETLEKSWFYGTAIDNNHWVLFQGQANVNSPISGREL
jgi:hypothetical protein